MFTADLVGLAGLQNLRVECRHLLILGTYVVIST